MRLELTGRHLSITPAVRKIVENQLAPTLRRLNANAVSAQVVLTREKARHLAEITLHARGEHFLHGAGAGRGVAEAMGAAIAKIDRQAEKLKGKWEGKRRKSPRPRTEAAAPAEASQDIRIIRARRYAVKPLSIEDAALEVGDAAENFLVFRNLANDTITVLFRRADGHLGLIEPDA